MTNRLSIQVGTALFISVREDFEARLSLATELMERERENDKKPGLVITV